MAAMFSMIFFVILLIVAVGVVWALWSLLAGLLTTRKLRNSLLGLPVSILVVAVATALIFFATNRPTSLFEREFDFAPPADVVFKQSHNFSLGDSGSTHLLFTASSATVNRIVQTAGFQAGDPHFSTNAMPDWYRPPSTNVIIYHRLTEGGANGGFSTEMRVLVFEASTGTVWYEFSGID